MSIHIVTLKHTNPPHTKKKLLLHPSMVNHRVRQHGALTETAVPKILRAPDNN